VRAAFASNFVPIDGGGGGGRVVTEGSAIERGKELIAGVTAVTPHLRQTLGVPLLRGRDFTDTEGLTRSAVALINHSMASQLWPGQDALGRRFRLAAGENQDWFTVVGIMADFRHYPPEGDDPPDPNAYIPIDYDPTLNTGLTIRVEGDPAGITSAVREQLRLSDPLLPLFQPQTMEELRADSFWQQRLFGMMFAVFGAIALLLAAVGVYGVLSYAVSQRTQEIGVRVALGAERSHVLRLIVGHGLRLAGAGVVLGLAGAFGVTRVIASQLYNITATDPATFGGVAAFLTLVAFLASYFPARRATAVDPIVALRNE
jgi:putative ABC transport system permease protein